MKWLVLTLAQRTHQVVTRQLCGQLLQDLEGVSSTTPSLDDLDRVLLQQTEQRWAPLLSLAKLLLRQASPDPGRAGAHEAVAILFTLHDLFERVLGRVFREGLTGKGLGLKRYSRPLLETLAPGSGQMMPLKPDFLFSRPGASGAVLIGDAKWKRILDSGAGFSLGEADAYQLTTYMAVFGVTAGFVFCPLSSPPAEGHLVAQDFRISGLGSTLHVAGIHLPTLIAATAAGAATRAALCNQITARAPPQAAAA